MKELPRYCENIKRKFGRTLYKKELLDKNDNIIIGLSGGKDSLVLTELLALQRKHLPFNINLTAIHILLNEAGYATDIKFLQEFCTYHNIELKIINKEIPNLKESKKSFCFICSWTRRKFIFEAAREMNANKIALGHNMDDAIETTIINMIHHGSISSIPFELNMFKNEIKLIRPLLEFTNDQMRKYSDQRCFPKEIKRCIHGENTSRNKVAEIINNMQDLNKDAKKNIFRAMNNIYPEYLPK